MRLALINRILGRKPDDGKATVRTLIKFLKEHGIRRQFIRAFNKHKLNPLHENLSDVCNETAPIDWIVLAFQWSVTKEGRDFWQHKNYEWIDYLISNDTKYNNLV